MREKKPLNLAVGQNVKLIREQAGLTEILDDIYTMLSVTADSICVAGYLMMGVVYLLCQHPDCQMKGDAPVPLCQQPGGHKMSVQAALCQLLGRDFK